MKSMRKAGGFNLRFPEGTKRKMFSIVAPADMVETLDKMGREHYCPRNYIVLDAISKYLGVPHPQQEYCRKELSKKTA